MKLSKINLSILILVIFHIAGVIAIGFQLIPGIVKLSWMNLILTSGLIIWNKTEKHTAFYLFLLVIFILGLTVEIIGVATGFPFGDYHYGESLGTKVMDVPWVLGLNWWILVYSSIHTVAFFTKNKIYSFFVPPALMLALDTFIEPICATLDFWYWKDENVPFQNYLSWYLISLVFIGAYNKWIKLEKINRVAIAAFLVQVLFFISLNLLLK